MPVPPYTPLPPGPLRSDPPDDFVAKAETHVAAQAKFGEEMHDIALYTQQQAELAVSTATTIIPVAAAAAASANFVGVWSALAGAVSVPASCHHANEYWMLITGVADVEAHEPGVAAAWQVLPLGLYSAATVSSADNITLTGLSARYQAITMTGRGRSVTLPAATTQGVGGPRFIIKNTGGYPFGLRNGAGVLLAAIAPGGTAYLALSDNSDAAGVWSVTGDRLQPGLITIDHSLGATYNATLHKQFVALDDDRSIHFASLAAGGFAAFCVDNGSGTVGTPVVVSSTNGAIPKHCFKITATTAVIFYGQSTSVLSAVVVTLSGATTLTVGGAATLNATNAGGENWTSSPRIVKLDATHYLVSYANNPNTSVAALEISGGTTCAWGTPVNILTSVSLVDTTTTYALTSDKALVIYLYDGAPPYSIGAVVVTVAGSVCTLGTPASVANIQTHGQPPSSCLLSATAALILTDDNGTNVSVRAITVAGDVATIGSPLVVEATGTMQDYLYYNASSALRHTAHLQPLTSTTALLWYINASSSRSVVLTESAGVVSKGPITYRAISNGGSSAAGFGFPVAFGDSEFLVVCQTLAGSQGYDNYLQPCRINGTDITVGATLPMPQVPAPPYNVGFTRLDTGRYVLTSQGSAYVGVPILVVESNGDVITDHGSIPSPGLYGPLAPRNVAPSRVVIETMSLANQSGESSSHLRVLNVEIAQ